jgi:hypothetical protein
VATQLDVIDVPYQGSLDFTANDVAVPASLSMYFINDGYTILIVNNAAMADNDVTIVSVADDVPGTTDLTETVAGESIRVFGPFEPLWWNNNGYVYVNFEDDTTVTVAALSLQF